MRFNQNRKQQLNHNKTTSNYKYIIWLIRSGPPYTLNINQLKELLANMLAILYI